jgi:hypothetical protein
VKHPQFGIGGGVCWERIKAIKIYWKMFQLVFNKVPYVLIWAACSQPASVAINVHQDSENDKF